MTDEYMLYAYPGDILSFLDDGVRTLEAAETLASVDGNSEMQRRIREHKDELAR